MSIKNKSTRHLGWLKKLLNKNQRVSLRTYWTTRYLLTLIIGLFIVAMISVTWIRHNTMESRLNMMRILSDNMADRIVDINQEREKPDGHPPDFKEKKKKDQLEIDPFTYIVDTEGSILSSNRPTGPLQQQLHPSIIENDETTQELTIVDQKFFVVKSPIELNDKTIGWVVMVESKENITHVNQEYTQLAVMIISLALLGWGAIYVLSSRLAKPIKDVADAAKLVAKGNYQVHIPNESKEKEVYELIQSFKEMTSKLENLESMRTELLAGVTHELKTPVTSISGLLQAIKDEVVTGDEAKEFLTISMNETEKMKTMVEDLLAFNQFATNAVQVKKENHEINDVVEDAIYSWEIAQKDGVITIQYTNLQRPVEMLIDPIRFQQIMTNLLNNANHAMGEQGQITVDMKETEKDVFIDVTDSGSGISEAEQDFIFERFFRGEKKKYKYRGLGLGLPLSKMIANALGGDLILVKSSEEGTTFQIRLPKMDS